MSVPIRVDEYSGHTASQRPRNFSLDGGLYEIATVLDQWYEPAAMYFKVQTTQDKTYLLRYEGHSDAWTLQSGFDGDELLARRSRDRAEGGTTDRRRNWQAWWYL